MSILLQLQEVYLPNITLATPDTSQTLVEIPSTSQLIVETPFFSQRLATILFSNIVILFASRLLEATTLSTPKSTLEDIYIWNSAVKTASQPITTESPFPSSNTTTSLLYTVFQIPRSIFLVADIPDNTVASLNIDILLFESSILSVPPVQVPQVLLLLQYNQPEIVYLWYKAEKDSYLAAYLVTARNKKRKNSCCTYNTKY
jgi:hypothetical protein